MSEMIERVALAMQENAEGAAGAFDKRPHDCYIRSARVAIEAMREPTKAMCFAGHERYSEGVWQAMIDEALK